MGWRGAGGLGGAIMYVPTHEEEYSTSFVVIVLVGFFLPFC